MLDPRTLAQRREEILESCRKRNISADLEAAIDAHRRVASALTELNDANQQRNAHAKGAKRKLEPAEREAHAIQGRVFKDRVAGLESELRAAESDLAAAASRLPNFLHPDVPEGGEDGFRLLKTQGEVRTFDFEPRDHLAVGKALELFDFEAGAKVAGTKFYFLKNEAVLLELALQRFALDVLIERGFTPHTTPDVARPEILEGTGFNPRGEETQIYSLSNADLCLIGTAEVTLGGLISDTIIEEADLPLRLAGLSHCFRTEAGAHGREGKGLYRVHQFTKVEMFVATSPEDSEAMHDELLAIEEHIFQSLELPYRVIDVASRDLGAPAYRKFDIEAWIPTRGESGDWGEVTSASNCTDYQARRLRIRMRRQNSKKNELVHTLNGTAVAVARTLVPLLENHQQKDGSITIPKALRPYFGRDVIEPRS